MQLVLRSGRLIHLASIHQYLTYGGLLVGMPDKERNDRKIEEILRTATADLYSLGEPFLVPPVRRPLRSGSRDLPTATYERLPDVVCKAVFHSDELNTPDFDDVYSSLVVVWFQDKFALPIDTDVQVAIEQIDWEQVAAGWTP